VFDPQRGPKGDVLVLVFLRGGMDGLHVVPPHGDAAYRKHRHALAVSEPGKGNGTRNLDGFFGLHPDLAPLHELYQDKQLAVVHASGSPDRTLSHFEAMQTMERGVADGNVTATGWIARHLAATTPESPTPLRAVAISDVLPKSMQGAIDATAVRSIAEYRLNVPDQWEDPFRKALGRMYATGSDLASTAGRGTLKLLTKLDRLDPAQYRPEGGAQYPEGDFGSGLKQVAQLIKADIGLEIAEVDLGGWDAHAVQIQLMVGLMQQLGKGLHALYSDLGERTKRVTVVAMSEFGRRVNENGSLGTDHGRATAMFLLGGGIRGGRVWGRWPGLEKEQLDKDGNLQVTTDYRDILGEIVDRRLGNPQVSRVFPEYEPSYLGLTA